MHGIRYQSTRHMPKSRIVMVNAPIHPIPPTKGAAVEWWMYQVSRRLVSLEPHLLCLAAEGQILEEVEGQAHFHRIRVGRIYRRLFQKITRIDPWSYAQRVARRIDHLQPPILHVHNAPALVPRLRSLCRWRPAVTLHHMHNAMALESPDPDIRLVANSQWLRNWYAERYPQHKIDVVTNGVDTEIFKPRWLESSDVLALKQDLALPTDRHVILFVGRISPEKGALDLIHAFEALLSRRRDVMLVLLGERRTDRPGNPRVEYGNAVASACERLGNHCRLLGVVPPADIQRYYRLGDLLVVPSEFEEPFGMVAIEGMAAGVPILVARRGGLPEFVVPGKTGHLINDAKNAAELADQINSLLDQPSELDTIARTARQYVEQNHDWDVVAHQLETLCEDKLRL